MTRPAYLRHSRHVVPWLLVGVDYRARHGPDCSKSLHVLVGEDGFAFLFALGQSNIEWLGGNDAPIHFSHSFCGLLRGREAHKAKPLAVSPIRHHLKEKRRLVAGSA